MFSFLDEQKAERLIVDLRQNAGGDFTRGLAELVNPLSRNNIINQPGHLYVLIGPATFSAAMVNAVHFRERTHAVLIGQAIGEKPNSYAEGRNMHLPNSHLGVNYSTEYYEFQKGGENVVRPDHEVATGWEAFLAGRDLAIEWIVAQLVTKKATVK